MKLHRMARKYYEQAGGEGDGGGSGGSAGDGSGGGAGGGDAGAGGFDWRSTIPEEYANEKSLSADQVKDLPSLFGQFVNAQKVIGQSVRIPGENASGEDLNKFYERLGSIDGVTRIPGAAATDEEKAAFWGKLGVPKSAEEYKPFDPSGLEIPEGVELKETLDKDFLPIAHKLNLNQDQVAGLGEWYSRMRLDEAVANKESTDAAVSELKKEYGQDYQMKFDSAVAVIEKVGSEQLARELESGLGNNPGLIKMLADLAPAVLEDGYFREGGGVKTTMTRSEVEAELNSVMGEKGYDNKNHPEHEKLMLRSQKLNAMLDQLDKA